MIRAFFVLAVVFGSADIFAAYQTLPKPTYNFGPNASGGHVVTNPSSAVNALVPKTVITNGNYTAATGAFGSDFARLMAQPVGGSPGTRSWEVGGNFTYVPRSATPTKTIPVKVISVIPEKALAKSILRALPGIGTAYSLFEIGEELARQGNQTEPPTPYVYDPAKGVYRSEDQVEWELANGMKGSSPQGVCTAFATANYQACANVYGAPSCTLETFNAVVDVPTGTFDCQIAPGQSVGSGFKRINPVELPMPENTIDDPRVTDGDPNIIDRAIKTGAPIPIIDFEPDTPPEVTGPGSITNSTTTTTKPNGDVVTNTYSTTINYIENRINVTTNITTTTKNSSGQTIPNDPADIPNPQSNAPAEEPAPESDLCKLHPEVLACQELDTPSDEPIPSETRDITLQTGPDFAGGACIPDVVATINGHQITVLAMAIPCGWISDLLKPLILLLASIGAVFIVMPRAGD